MNRKAFFRLLWIAVWLGWGAFIFWERWTLEYAPKGRLGDFLFDLAPLVIGGGALAVLISLLIAYFKRLGTPPAEPTTRKITVAFMLRRHPVHLALTVLCWITLAAALVDPVIGGAVALLTGLAIALTVSLVSRLGLGPPQEAGSPPATKKS